MQFSKHYHQIRSDQISRSVVSDSLRPHESQHARPTCPSPTPGVHWDSRPCLGLAEFDLVWLGLVRFGGIWLGLAGLNLVWLDLFGRGWIWLGLVGFGWVCLGLVGLCWVWFSLVRRAPRNSRPRLIWYFKKIFFLNWCDFCYSSIIYISLLLQEDLLIIF